MAFFTVLEAALGSVFRADNLETLSVAPTVAFFAAFVSFNVAGLFKVQKSQGSPNLI